MRQIRASQLFVFEPAVSYIAELKESLKQYPAKVLNFGLGNSSRIIEVEDLDKGTSAFRTRKCTLCTKLDIREVTLALDALSFNKRGENMIYMNCEGCEYEVLAQLIKTGYIKHFKFIHYGTHSVAIPNLEKVICGLREELSKTHVMHFGLLFAQDRWKLRDMIQRRS